MCRPTAAVSDWQWRLRPGWQQLSCAALRKRQGQHSLGVPLLAVGLIPAVHVCLVTDTDSMQNARTCVQAATRVPHDCTDVRHTSNDIRRLTNSRTAVWSASAHPLKPAQSGEIQRCLDQCQASCPGMRRSIIRTPVYTAKQATVPMHTCQGQIHEGQNAVLNSTQERLQLLAGARLCFVTAQACQCCSSRLSASTLLFARQRLM